jgi:hypothetical protein
VLRRLGVGFDPIDRERLDPDAWLRREAPAALLTTTSWGQARIEPEFIAAARRNGVPSLAVVDFWSNYRARFERDGGAAWPDRIALPDEQARAEAIRDGLPPAALVATGNPHHEALLARATRSDPTPEAFRAGAGVQPGAALVLFASQPIAALYDDRLGYTERSVLAAVVAALDDVAEWLGRPIVLGVRPHPRETAAPLVGGTSRVAVIDASLDDPLDWCLAADLVVGMTSALLFDAALLGRPVVSAQPDLIGADVLPSNRLGLSVGVYRTADLSPALARSLALPPNLPVSKALSDLRASAVGATGRLLREVESLGSPMFSGVLS